MPVISRKNGNYFFISDGRFMHLHLVSFYCINEIAGRLASIGDKRDLNGGNLKERGHLGRPRSRWVDNIKLVLNTMEGRGLD
jgi:hypothetical protein